MGGVPPKIKKTKQINIFSKLKLGRIKLTKKGEEEGGGEIVFVFGNIYVNSRVLELLGLS